MLGYELPSLTTAQVTGVGLVAQQHRYLEKLCHLGGGKTTSIFKFLPSNGLHPGVMVKYSTSFDFDHGQFI